MQLLNCQKKLNTSICLMMIHLMKVMMWSSINGTLNDLTTYLTILLMVELSKMRSFHSGLKV